MASDPDSAETPDTAGESDANATPEPDVPQETGDAAHAVPTNGGDAATASADPAAPMNGEDRDPPAADMPEFLRISL